MNDQAVQIGAPLLPHLKRALLTSVTLLSLGMALAGCGGGGDGAASSASTESPQDATSPAPLSVIVPPDATFRGKTYTQWAVASWQWAMALPIPTPQNPNVLPHPFVDCNNRPISAAQTGNVWYWGAPIGNGPAACDQSANVVPAGTAIFLAVLDVEASSLDAAPFQSDTAAGQQAIAQWWVDHIVGLYCSIDGVAATKLQNFRFPTTQFNFFAPTPWIFNNTGGNGTSAADGYYLMLQLSPGPHTIHYGGIFHFKKGEQGPGGAVFEADTVIPTNITLHLTVGA